MVGDVVARPATEVELLEVADEVAQPPLRPAPGRQHLGLVQQDRQRIRDRAVFDHKRAVHIDLAKGEFGIEENPSFRG